MHSMKSIFVTLGGAAFFVASVLIALSARRYQAIGQPMPNGKGGFMEFQHGYYLAIVLFLFSVVWLMVARRCWRSPSA